MPTITQDIFALEENNTYSLDYLFSYTLSPANYYTAIGFVVSHNSNIQYSINGVSPISTTEFGNPVDLYLFLIDGDFDVDDGEQPPGTKGSFDGGSITILSGDQNDILLRGYLYSGVHTNPPTTESFHSAQSVFFLFSLLNTTEGFTDEVDNFPSDLTKFPPTNQIWNPDLPNFYSALAGDDIVSSGASNDVINGGSGNDTIDGGAHDDTLFGDADNDSLMGGAGNDRLEGGDNNDFADGGTEEDKIFGGGGNDTLTGGAGNDRLDGGAGNDTISGGEDTDPSARDEDTVVFSGRPTDYKFEELITSRFYKIANIDSTGETDLVDATDIEKFQFDGPGTNNVFSSISEQQYLEMAFLSNRAYGNTAGDVHGWRPIISQELGLPRVGLSAAYGVDYSMSTGVYRSDNAAAHVYAGQVGNKNTLVVAFRGTDDLGDVADYVDFRQHFERFRPLVDALKTYVNDGANEVDQIWITGHSLGGAMAQMLLQEVRGDTRWLGATFGSPGAPDHLPDDRLVNFLFTQDPVGFVQPAALGLPAVIGALVNQGIGAALGGLVSNATGYEHSGHLVRLVNDSTQAISDIASVANSEHLLNGYIDGLEALYDRAETGLLSFLSSGAAPSFSNLSVGGGTVEGDSFRIVTTTGQWFHDGDELLIGSTDSDTLIGNAGADFLFGWQGDDVLEGGLGKDIFVGTKGDIHGDTVTDLSGGERIRVLGASFGDDAVRYDPIAEQLLIDLDGDDSPDIVVNMENSLFGVSTQLFGSFSALPGNEERWGGTYTDIVYTGALGRFADDLGRFISGGDGEDSLVGGAGNDTAAGGLGSDRVVGGLGADTFVGTPSELDGDVVLDFAPDDRIRVLGTSLSNSDLAVTTGSAVLHIDTDQDGMADTTITLLGQFVGRFDVASSDGFSEITFVPGVVVELPITLFGGNGDDSLVGGAGNDLLNGGNGNDSIFGGSGEDRLSGGNGRDIMEGGIGNDSLSGGNGSDVLRGGNDDDLLFGGNGDDDLRSGAGDDSLNGGNGRDTISGGSGNDILVGGNGRDTFVFEVNSGADVVRDFRPNLDILDLSDLFSDFSDVQGLLSQSGVDVRIALGSGNQITLAGVNLVSIDSSDFILSL